MDYKYIEQLLDRYWQGETTLEEERILRAFFSQESVPPGLLFYKDLFVYAQSEKRQQPLDESFDERMLAMVNEPAAVAARTVSLSQRLRPLFRAAAVVAIILTLGNAIQVPFQQQTASGLASEATYDVARQGLSVAMGDSIRTDSLKEAQATATIR